MRYNPERLAWIILLLSFFTCIGLVIAVPTGIRYYILHARMPQKATLEVQQGPLSMTEPGRSLPAAIVEKRDDISERTTIVATDATAGRLVLHPPQEQENEIVFASIQIYDNTEVTLLTADSPRFPASPHPHEVVLEVKTGRVRINVANDAQRPTIVEVRTPHGKAILREGSYEAKVNGTETEVSVRTGQANVTNSGNEALSLSQAERAIVSHDYVSGPLPAARNLITNGDFQAPLENGWTTYHEQKEDPPPDVNIITDEGREVANFYRDGSNHAEVGIKQNINNYDVRDFSSLELHLALQIVHEDITGYGGCGTLSSECPLIVLLDYKDIYDTDRQWRHGFYIGEPAPDWLLYPWTEQVPAMQWQTYDSGNLMRQLTDNPPAFIKSLTIYASGHSFEVMVTEVELFAQE